MCFPDHCIPNLGIKWNILLPVCFLHCAHTLFLEGRVPVMFSHVCSPAAAALYRAHHVKGRAHSSTLWIQQHKIQERIHGVLASIWSSGSSPMLLWVHQLFHAFSSLLVFILPVSVMGISRRRNCKGSLFRVCEKLKGSLSWCRGHIWDIPASCTAAPVLGVANNQKNHHWFFF